MNSHGTKMVRQQCLMRTSVAMLLATSLCLAWYQDANAQKGVLASKALKLLGKFAAGVMVSLATDEVKAAIRPDQKEPGKEVPSKEVPRKPEKPEPEISGYEFLLAWQSHDGTYTGTLVMQGTRGRFRVHTPMTVIDQDMAAQHYGNDILLVGTNPRHAGSFVPVRDYSPDTFRLTQLSNGEWTIADTCDTQGMCAPVRVVEGRIF